MPKNSKNYTKVKKIANPTRVTIVNDDFDLEVEGGSNFDDPVNNNSSSLDEQWKNDAIGDDSQTGASAKKGMPGQNDAKKFGRERERGASGKDKDAVAKKAGGMDAVKGLEGAKLALGKLAYDNNKRKEGMMANWKQYTPLGGLVGLIMLVGMFIFGAQSLAPFGFAANALDQLNVLRTSMSKRTTYMRRMQLDSTRNTSLTKVGLFGEKFQISSKMKKKLGKNGIGVDKINGVKVLKYTDAETGESFVVAANEKDRRKLSSNGADIDVDGKKMKVYDMDTAIKSNKNFDLAQTKATRTLKGHIAGWFDSASGTFHSLIGNTRNKYKDTQGDANDEKVRKKVTDAAESGGLKKAASSTPADTEEDPETEHDRTVIDEDGNVTTVRDENGDTIKDPDPPVKQDYGDDSLDAETGKSPEAISNKLTSRAKKAMSAANGFKEVGCMAMKGIGAIAMTVTALQTIRVLNYATQFLEAVDNVKAGNGTAALNMNMEAISTPGNTENPYKKGELISENKSGMASAAWNAFFGGPAISPDDAVAKQFNTDDMVTNALTAVAGEDKVVSFMGALASKIGSAQGVVKVYQTCAVMSIGISMVSAGLDIVELVGAFVPGPGWIVAGATALIKGIALASVMAAAGLIVQAAINAIVPYVAKLLVSNLLFNEFGEAGTYALASGAKLYMAKNTQIGSGKPGTEPEVLAMYRDTQDVIAEEAKYDRMTRSPFDMTSKNTFLGSIAYSLMPIGFQLTNQTGFSGAVSKTLTTTSSAVASLTGVKAYADEVSIATGLNNDCPSLAASGLVGDAFCNAYYVSGFTSASSGKVETYYNKDPAKVLVDLCTLNKDNFEDGICEKYVIGGGTASGEYEGNPKINKKGEFAKWIVSCPLRESQWGYWDQKTSYFVANTGSVALDTVINGGVGSIPVIGDVVGILQDGSDMANEKWSTGAACSEEKYRVYSQYSEDQRWLENEGLIDKSSVVAFMDEYFEENPIDNSLEGQIARYTGMSAEQVDEALGLIEYYQFLAEYNPDERVALYEVSEPKYYKYEGNNEESPIMGVLSEKVVYFDLRGRTYTV